MMDDQVPLLSVVMCVYNGERFLREAMDSILAQTYRDYELIVVDDASTDVTSGILGTYTDPRIILLRNEVNLGPYRSANKGLSIIRGQLIARHDADDVSHPDRFKKQVAFMLANPTIGLLGSYYQRIDRNGLVIDTAELPTSNSDIQRRLESGNIFQGAVMMRRSVLEKAGGYREYFRVSQDYDLWLRMAEISELAILPEYLYQYRFHSESISRKKREFQLACGRYALALALQRRSGVPEGPIPEDVTSVYKPEPERIFQDARGIVYLNYASGQLDKAAEAIILAQEILQQKGDNAFDWQAWVLSRALTLTHLRNDANAGAGFITWFFSVLHMPGNGKLMKETLGRYYADRAFAAYKSGSKRDVLSSAWHALRNDRGWLGNPGLWSICIRSL